MHGPSRIAPRAMTGHSTTTSATFTVDGTSDGRETRALLAIRLGLSTVVNNPG